MNEPFREYPTARLAAAIAAAFAGVLAGSSLQAVAADIPYARSAANLPAASVVVTSCADSNDPGTLRNAISTARTGQVIDMSQLSCNEVQLSPALGQLVASVDDLTISAGAAHKTIYGSSSARVISLAGAGTLTLEGLLISNGGGAHAAGGCIYSHGSVNLVRTRVQSCIMIGNGAPAALGGAVYAARDVRLLSSVVTNSEITSSQVAAGGAIAAGNSVYLGPDPQNPDGGGSAVLNSSVIGAPGSAAGAISAPSITLKQSAVAGCSGYSVGAIQAGVVQIFSSTITGNTTTGQLLGGPIVYVAQSALIDNSTFAINTTPKYGALRIGPDTQLTVTSSIFAKSQNTQGQFVPDLSQVQRSTPPVAPIQGSNNLVEHTGGSLPADTIIADPKLAAPGTCPLPNAAQVTLPVVPLQAGSPALLRGRARDLPVDQCGNSFGDGTRVDIGARQQSPAFDRIFADSFEAR